MANSSTAETLYTETALKSWAQWLGRLNNAFDTLTDEQMLREITPGRNRAVYLLGHLIAVNDSMIPQLRLGEPSYPELPDLFIKQPDSASAAYPPVAQLRQNWKDVNLRLDSLFAALTPAQWLERHSTVSEEEFASQPHRNRLAILLSRTNHASYHLGQLVLLDKQG